MLGIRLRVSHNTLSPPLAHSLVAFPVVNVLETSLTCILSTGDSYVTMSSGIGSDLHGDSYDTIFGIGSDHHAAAVAVCAIFYVSS
jgi:hypothetical protein